MSKLGAWWHARDVDTQRFIFAAALLIGVLLSAFTVKTVENWQTTQDYTVSQLIQEKPFGAQIETTGNVVDVLEDYTSQKGNVYQQFHISDGVETVLIFCSTWNGRVSVEPGDTVTVKGEFQKFNEKLEVYADCTEVQVD